MYCRDKMEHYDHVERYEYMHRLSTYMQEYEQMDSGKKEMWEAKKVAFDSTAIYEGHDC